MGKALPGKISCNGPAASWEDEDNLFLPFEKRAAVGSGFPIGLFTRLVLVQEFQKGKKWILNPVPPQ
jgi:hypothetical protein